MTRLCLFSSHHVITLLFAMFRRKVPNPPPRRAPSPPKTLTPSTRPPPSAYLSEFWGSSPRSAFSPSNILFAAKALFIATALVGAGAVTVIHTVKYTTGVRSISEFNHLMQHWAHLYLPRISSDDPDDWSWEEPED